METFEIMSDREDALYQQQLEYNERIKAEKKKAMLKQLELNR